MPPALPTLLVFTLGPAADSRRRSWLPAAGRALSHDLFAACLAEALAAGRACGMRLRMAGPSGLTTPPDVTATPQRGMGFAERFRGAVETAFATSHGPLVVVGTDSPGLASTTVAHALRLLEEDPATVVIGPAPDGGFYLLAAAQPLDVALAETRFCRRDTLARLRASLAATGRSVVLLQPLGDLDGRADLERFAAAGRALEAAWRRLALAVARLLVALSRPLAPVGLGSPLPELVPVRAGRAPPRF